MNYSLVTAPSVEPITLEEAKLFLRVDNDVEDTLINSLIASARVFVESETWRSLCTQTWKLSMDTTEVKTFVGLTKSPIQSITHIKYFDINGVQQTLSTGGFQSDLLNEPARIKFESIPQMKEMMNAMEIQFVCGYGVAASVPEGIKQAMKLLIGHWYEHRESVATNNLSEMPMAVKSLLAPYTIYFYQY
jgi:uncharacterized phiE125 gp8 family phage protein